MAAPTLQARAHSGPSYTTLLDSTLYAGDIDDVRLECVSLAEGYCAADFTSGVTVNFHAVPNVISLDPLPDEHLVYMRWEPED